LLSINENFYVRGRSLNKVEMLSALEKDWKSESISQVELYINTNLTPVSKTFQAPFLLSSVDSIFKQDLAKLEEFLAEKVLPLMPIQTQLDLPRRLTCDIDYVQFEPSDAKTYFDAAVAPDKAFAVVVAGESGSGKSVFSCLQAKECGYTVLYVLLKGTDLEHKPIGEFPLTNTLFRLLINKMEGPSGTPLLHRLYSKKETLNQDRNRWAKKVLEAALHRVTKDGGESVQDWVAGKWPRSKRPKKVALVIDEATDVDLVEGLVDVVREIKASYFGRLAAEALSIVLVGTGLDAIRYPERVGTNPDYSRLVTVKSPNVPILQQREQLSSAIEQAIEKGTFSRVLSTNSRMFFHAVLPILSMPMHDYDAEGDGKAKGLRLEERLREIGSFRHLMDFAPRLYVRSNSIANVTASARSNLLQEAFVYHMVAAMEAILASTTKSDSLKQIILAELAVVKKFAACKRLAATEQKEIFTRGLAKKSETSMALKYLACFGLTCELRPGFGNEFEELTALHYLRCMQVQGYSTQRCVLKHAWPPKSDTKTIGTAEIAALKKKCKAAGKDEFADFDFSSVQGMACVVFSQGTATAQGGDILALVVNGVDAALESIQCKHYSRSNGPASVRNWWCSLGISMDGDGDANLEPADGPAGHSFAGLESFRALLEEKLGGNRKVTLGRRIIAASFKTPDTAHFPVPAEEGKVGVWFREMLEPTISVVSLREAAEPEDDLRE
jgi:hypothetical protein